MKYIGKSKKGFPVYEYNKEDFKTDYRLVEILPLFEISNLDSFLKGEISYKEYTESFLSKNEGIDERIETFLGGVFFLEDVILSLGGKL